MSARSWRKTIMLLCVIGIAGCAPTQVVEGQTADIAGGRMQWTNSVTNRADARVILDRWAKQLRAALDRLNGRGTT